MQPTITVYSSPTCGFCHMAMQYFDDKGFAYTEKDITTDEEAYNFVTQEVGQAVTPVITIGDTVVVGFDRPKIDKALEGLQGGAPKPIDDQATATTDPDTTDSRPDNSPNNSSDDSPASSSND